MISKFTLKFLTDLHHKNIRPWYHANKDRYKDAGNFEDLVAILLHTLVNLVTLKQVKEDGQFDEFHLVKFGRFVGYAGIKKVLGYDPGHGKMKKSLL